MNNAFVKINDIGKTILSFVGTEEFEKILGSIEDNSRAGFTTGLSIAASLIMSQCTQYIATTTAVEPEG